MYFCMSDLLFSGDPRFLVNRLLAAPMTEFLELDLPLNLFLVLVGIIIPPLADGTSHRDQTIGSFRFCHGENDNVDNEKMQQLRVLLVGMTVDVFFALSLHHFPLSEFV